MTRIIAGTARGRRLSIPAKGTRPTSDRVREALFASIDARLAAQGRSWNQVAVCDLWSGSGAIALEAWSRGATRVLAVERAPAAIRAIDSNISQLGATGVTLLRADAGRALMSPPPAGAFDVVIADPPYDDDAASVQEILSHANAAGWFAPGAIVIVERDKRGRCPFPDSLATTDERTYGDTVLWYGRATDGREEQPR
jgi:16S rRNA (guanine966-N2)-methyltransferase